MPDLPTLRKYVRLDAHLLSFQVPTWHWAWRGLLLLFFVTPLATALGIAAYFAVEPDELPALTILMALMGAFTAIGGVAFVALGPIFSKRTQVSIDLANGFVTSAREPYPIPVSTLTGLRLSRPNPLSSFCFLEATRAGTAVVLLGPLIGKHTPDASTLATWLGDTLRIPVDPNTLSQASGSGAAASPEADRFAGLLCYFPIQGIFIIASLYYLFAAGKQRPFVRFCAIQSLSQLAFSIAVLAGILIALGVPVGLLDDSPLRVALIVLLAAALGVFWLWNFGAHAYACVSAYKGRAWVMPWLGFWSRRFLP